MKTSRMDATNAPTVTISHHQDLKDSDGHNGDSAQGVVAVDPLVHWSDVMPTLDLPPPPLTSPTNRRDLELESFAQDMELLGDFLMDAMAAEGAHHHHHDAHEGGDAVGSHHYYHDAHEGSYHADTCQDQYPKKEEEEETVMVFNVDEELPPPPLLLPPPAVAAEVGP